MSADIFVGSSFLPARRKHDESPVLPNVSLSMLENWLSSYSRPSQSAAPIVASTITIEAIQNLLHTTGFPIEAPSNQDVFFGPFEDTQFDLVVDVETSHECLEDIKLKDLDTCSECDYGGSDLSEDEFHFFQEELPLSPDSPLLSDCELDFSNDSGIEAEVDELCDITDSQQEKENRSERCGDRNAPSDSNTQGTPPEDEQNKSNTVQQASLGESNGKLKGTNVVEKMKDDDQEDDPPAFHCQYLWEFLHHLLSEKHDRYIVWKNQSKGVFHLIDHNGVARLWGKHKKRKNMTYEKLSRALRYYYSKNILRKVPGQRLTYKFVRNLSGKKYPL